MPILLAPVVALAPVTNVNFLSLAALIVALLYGVSALARRAVRRPTGAEALVLAFAAYAVASLLWTEVPSPTSSYITIIAYAGSAVMFVMVLRRSKSAEGWRFLAYAYLAGCAFATAGVIESSAGRELLMADERAAVAGVNANYTAYSLLTGVPLMAALYWEATRFRLLRGALTLAGTAAMGWAIVMSGSRGAAVGLFAIPVFIGARALGLKTKGAAVLVVCAAALALLYARQIEELIPARAAFRSLNAMEDVSSGRYALWQRAFEEFQRSPWFGSGADSYLLRAGGGIHVHNVFLSVLAEMGIVGFALFIAMLVAIGWEYFGREAPEWAQATRTLVVVVWLVVAMTGVWQYALPAWFAFAWAANYPGKSPQRSRTGGQGRWSRGFNPGDADGWREPWPTKNGRVY